MDFLNILLTSAVVSTIISFLLNILTSYFSNLKNNVYRLNTALINYLLLQYSIIYYGSVYQTNFSDYATHYWESTEEDFIKLKSYFLNKIHELNHEESILKGEYLSLYSKISNSYFYKNKIKEINTLFLEINEVLDGYNNLNQKEEIEQYLKEIEKRLFDHRFKEKNIR